MKRLAVVFLLAVLLLPSTALPEAQKVPERLQGLVGEDRLYSIAFLFFDHLGEGALRFEETEQADVFRAELVGRTLGIASWLSGNRTQIYSSTMQLLPDGSLNSMVYSSKIEKKRTANGSDTAKYVNTIVLSVKYSKKKSLKALSSHQRRMTYRQIKIPSIF